MLFTDNHITSSPSPARVWPSPGDWLDPPATPFLYDWTVQDFQNWCPWGRWCHSQTSWGSCRPPCTPLSHWASDILGSVWVTALNKRKGKKNLRPIWSLRKDFKIHDPGLLLLLTKYCTTKKLITLKWILKCQPSSSWKRWNDLRFLTSCCLDWWMTLALVGILSSALRMLNSTLGRLTSCRAFHSSRDISTSILTSNSPSFSCALNSR